MPRDRKAVDESRVRQLASYKTVECLKKCFPIKSLCKVLGISRASYYKWCHRGTPEYEVFNNDLSAIYDLQSKKILSYEISKKNNNELVFNTFKKAQAL